MNTRIRDYWNSVGELPKELIGCYPMGGGGVLEAPYRHFFELKHLRKVINFQKNMNVLELGCGNGRWIVSLAPLVKNYTAVDFSEPALAIAKERVQEAGISNVEFYEQQILSFKSEKKYHIIYFSGVTQYLQDDEIKTVLANLVTCISAETIIVDRSTINYSCREILNKEGYFSIFRIPTELYSIFENIGFKIAHQKRSYLFLRCGRFLNRKPFRKTLPLLCKLFSPLSYYFLFIFSWCADYIYPIPFEGGNRSHDFMVFKMADCSNAKP
jgi:SAM-dependent methyltransferase